ncbi:MAG: hypothetical protein M3Y81_21500, partial [Chloroflexota bacterium]|nr:hypothetical protein [Chloroflexota bacterium]
ASPPAGRFLVTGEASHALRIRGDGPSILALTLTLIGRRWPAPCSKADISLPLCQISLCSINQ